MFMTLPTGQLPKLLTSFNMKGSLLHSFTVSTIIFAICCQISTSHLMSRFRATEPQHYPTEERWFDQDLDHFNHLNTGKWKQRYFVNSTMHKDGGPIFLSIGGESPANSIWMSHGQWINWAEKFGAYCFLLEHRYYGKSRPTADLHVKKMVYLSSAQALADIANFRVKISQEMGFKDNKWIVFGGSYSGALAAWFGLKYPHLIAGAIASSAPLVSKVNFKEYLKVVAEVINATDKACYSSIKDAVSEFNEMLKDRKNASILSEQFKLCDKIQDPSNENDIRNLHSELISNFQDVVQYNKDNREFEGAKATEVTVNVVCSVMTNESIGNAVLRYAKVNSIIMEAYNVTCLDYKYNKMVTSMRNTSWDSDAAKGVRQWTFQTCTEFGFFQSTDYLNQPFGDNCPVDFFIQQCQDIFGNKFNADFIWSQSNATNIMNGGLNKQLRRVLLPNGSIDPWHYLGATQDISDYAKAIYINGTAHCADMYPTSANDTSELSAAREIIWKQLSEWLQ